MKENKINSVLNNIRIRTELLESLSWDESQLDSLFEYLLTALNKDTDLSIIILYVKDNYGNSAFEIIKKLFIEESLLTSVGFYNEN